MVKTGEIKQRISYINIDNISSVEKYVGELLNEGKEGTKIVMNNGSKFTDYRQLKEFTNLIYINS